MTLDQVKYVYFIGIGGIGMSALARYFKKLGCLVSGYDRTESPLTRQLVMEGITVQYDDDFTKIDPVFLTNGAGQLIVYTPAVPRDMNIMAGLKDVGHTLYKRSQVLGLISEGRYTIAIAGTHGKTTTSTMVAHILTDSGYGCSAFLGGISTNYNTNTLFGDNEVLVVEADEYDRSFLTLHPDIAIVTSADADHLDIYGTHEELTSSFKQFLSQVSPDGNTIIHAGLPFEGDIFYSADGTGQVYAENIRVEDGHYFFDYIGSHQKIENIQMGIPGRHNVENAVAAITSAILVDIPANAIKDALANFKGVKRRFEYVVQNERQIYIDDYAHHPKELSSFISSIRELYPDLELTVVFQPHLYTRTRDFFDGFAEVLGKADVLLLMDIYPARELPIEGVNSQVLLDKIECEKKFLLSKDAVLDYVKNERPTLLVTVGAGDIDRLVNPLKEIMDHG